MALACISFEKGQIMSRISYIALNYPKFCPIFRLIMKKNRERENSKKYPAPPPWRTKKRDMKAKSKMGLFELLRPRCDFDLKRDFHLEKFSLDNISE